jgi:hypothetical protein
VFEGGLQRKIFGPPKRDEMTDWKRLHNEKLHEFYCLPDVITVFKSKGMGRSCGSFG